MTISYVPSNDELILEFSPIRGKPDIKSGGIKLWRNDKGGIRGIAITNYVEELNNFRHCRNTIQLGGIWENVNIDDGDIRDFRDSVIKRFEERW